MLSFINVSLKLAENVILDQVNWQIQAKERIALVGRNGAGKSTLLKLLLNEFTPDSGRIQTNQGIRLAGLTQEVPQTQSTETVYDFLVNSLGPIGQVLADYRHACNQGKLNRMAELEQQIESANAWGILPRIEIMASHLSLDMDKTMQALSGGMKRRTLLASALIAEPDLLLLDEPTNHLDVTTIEWLESYLAHYPGSILLVTHDRQFLANVANCIVEIDRGKLQGYQCNYATYLDRREANRLAEKKQDELFDKRLSQEEVWIRQGVQARRTRNEGRVLRLKAMREEYKNRRTAQGKVNSIQLNTAYSGKAVLTAEKVHYALEDKVLLDQFSFVLTRGDKVGIIGPNGCGKTTLIRLLLGDLSPNSGSIERGTGLEIAYFDQLRNQLNEQHSVMANVADGADFVTVNGKQKHVASYLREFLFSAERLNQPVSSLSGGERNRLLLAKLLAKPVNLLVMDEPTNDLDIETLELLETLLVDYPGTLLLISHDREFLDHVVQSVLVYERPGHFVEFVGGYADYLAHKKQHAIQTAPSKKIPATPIKKTSSTNKLSYHEQQELKQLPAKIEQLEQTIQIKHNAMTQADFYQQTAEQIVIFNTELAHLEQQLNTALERWESLEARQA
jgi:ATP-binding cassette subfamily F protein uup